MGLLDDAIREHLELKRSHGADPGEVARAEREALGPVRAGGDLAGEPPLDPLGPETDLESHAPDDPRPGQPDDAPEGLHDDEVELHPTEGSPSPELGAFHDRQIAVAGQETAEYDLGAEAGHERGDPLDEEASAQPQEPRRSWVPRLSRARAQPARAADGSAADEPPAPADAEAHAEPGALGRPDAHGEPLAGGSVGAHAESMAGGSQGDAQAEPSAGAEHPPAEDVLEETPEFLQETPEHERLWFEQSSPRDFDFGR